MKKIFYRKKFFIFPCLAILPTFLLLGSSFLFFLEMPQAQAALNNFCTTRTLERGVEEKKCFPSLKFQQSADTQKVNTSFLKRQEPRNNKFWVKRSIGNSPSFSNRNVRVPDAEDLPTLEMVDRQPDASNVNLNVVLRVRGKTREYWHVPEGKNANGLYISYTTLPADLEGKKCACAPDRGFTGMDIGLSIRDTTKYRYCGFVVYDSYWMDRFKTTNPNDCYVETREYVRTNTTQGREERIYEPRYYRVKKVPAFSLERITHDDKVATDEFVNKTKDAVAAEQRHKEADNTYKSLLVSGPLPQKIRWRVFYRPRLATEDSYDTGDDPRLNYYGSCGCDNTDEEIECNTGSAISIFSNEPCSDKFSVPAKTEEEIRREVSTAQAERDRAKEAYCQVVPEAKAAKSNQQLTTVAAIQRKERGRYYPYELRSEANSSQIREGNKDFIMLYQGNKLLPDTFEAVPVDVSGMYASTNFSNECRWGGYFQDIRRGEDNKGAYVDYTVNALGESTTSVSNIAASVGARNIQSLGGMEQNSYYRQTCNPSASRGFTTQAIPGNTSVPIAGTECRVKLYPRFFDTEITYFYSTGQVETPPVEIQSFAISATDIDGTVKTKETGLCRSGQPQQSNCLRREDITDTEKQDLFQDGRKPSRPDRHSSQPQETLDITVEEGSTLDNITLSWATKYAAGIKLSPPRPHQNMKNQPLQGTTLNNALDSRDNEQSVEFAGKKVVNGLRPGLCGKSDDGQKEVCAPAIYSFYLTATNDNAVKGDENDYVWSVAQRIDVKVTKKERNLAEEYGICMKKAMDDAQEAANSDYVARAGCFGLQYGAELGVKALTGGMPVVGDLVGGAVGGLCDTGLILAKLEKFKRPCETIYTPPGKTQNELATIFANSMAKQFFTQFFTGLFQGFLGALFNSISCIPILNSIFNFFSDFIGAGIGKFVGNLITQGMVINTDNDPAALILESVGGSIGGGLGKAVGKGIGSSLGGQLQKFLGFGNIDPQSAQCGQKKDKYACVLLTGICSTSPVGIYESYDSCNKDCKIQLPPSTSDTRVGSLEVGGGITKTGLDITGLVTGQIQAIDCVGRNILIATSRPNVVGTEKTGDKDSSGNDIVRVKSGPFKSTNDIRPMSYLRGFAPRIWQEPLSDWNSTIQTILLGTGFDKDTIPKILAQRYEYNGKTKLFKDHIISCFAK